MKTKHTRLAILLVAVIVINAILGTGCRRSNVESTESDAASGSGSVTVATIGDISISKDELLQRLAQRIQPQRDSYDRSDEPVTAESVLHEMLAEKAMVLEGRALGYAEDESVVASVNRFRQPRVISAFLGHYYEEHIPVSQAEMDAKISADPNVTPEQAKILVMRDKVAPVYQALYAELEKKFELQRIEKNFARAAQIYHRLLTQPAEPRGRTVFWITNHQIKTELTRDERAIVLATYKGGQFTLYDWFKAVNEIAPPGRSKDLSTPAGVEKLLNRALQPLILEAEAVEQGYGQDKELVRMVREREDMAILGKIRTEKYKEVQPPTDEEIKAYFEQNPERFAKEATLKIDQIWCKDLQTAEDVKKAVESGEAFDTVKAAQSLRPDEPERTTSKMGEGVFWDELWKGDPNDIVGPVKGFYDGGIKWRVVKIIEKTPSEMRPFSDAIKNQVQSALTSQRIRENIDRYSASLLDKYPHKVYSEKLKDIDPLKVTPVEAESKS